MQERLLEQADKLETTETRLKEVEALPGFRSFVWLATTVASAIQLGGQGAAGAVEGLARAGRVLRSFFVLLVCRLPLWCDDSPGQPGAPPEQLDGHQGGELLQRVPGEGEERQAGGQQGEGGREEERQAGGQ